MDQTMVLDHSLFTDGRFETAPMEEQRREARLNNPDIALQAQRRGWGWLLGYKHCRVTDISRGGIGISSRQLGLSPRQTIDLVVGIQGEVFRATGFVCDSRDEYGAHYYNLCFIRAPMEMLALVQQYYAESEEDTAPNYRAQTGYHQQLTA